MVDRSTVITPQGDTAWVYDPQHNEIDFVSTANASLYSYSLTQNAFTRTLAIGGSPNGIAISADGQELVIGNAKAVPVGSQSDLAITRLNLGTGVVDQVLAPAVSSSAGVGRIVVDANGTVHFTASVTMYDKGFLTFPVAASTAVGQDDLLLNALVNPPNHMSAGSYLLTSPDHRFMLIQDSAGAPSELVLYDAQSSSFIAMTDPYHGVQGFQTGRGDISNSGLVADVTYNTIEVFDQQLHLVKDLTSYQRGGTVGAVFSQDARDLFVWNQEQKTLLVFDTQTWANTASLTTTTGGVTFNTVPAHAMQVVDHGSMLALDDGVHGVELIDLTARLGIAPGAPPSADPIAPLPKSHAVATTVTMEGDMDRTHLSDLLAATITGADNNGFAAAGPGGLAISLQGANLTYANNQLVAGTVKYVDFTDVQGGATTLHFYAVSGSGWPAAPFESWLKADAALSAFQTILAGDDGIRGGAGADVIHGYAGDDLISGGGGSDTVFGGAGDDIIYAMQSPDQYFTLGAPGATYLRGEDGDDYIVGGPGFDDINGNTGNDTLSGGAGDDWVVGGKDNDLLFGDAGDDIVYGNLGNDTCVGGAGNDLVRGGQGNDILYGGAGNDWLSGDRGDDTITGGAGADTFHTFSGAGIDRVLDFSAAEGDRVQLDPGTHYSVSQVGADTVIHMGGGDQMTLVGVQMSSLPPGWIFGA
jgi:Ca2+-binding RTX toxin-like protein